MNKTLNKRRKEQLWQLLDDAEFHLMSLKDDLTGDTESIGLEIEKQRKKLLDATRLTRRK